MTQRMGHRSMPVLQVTDIDQSVAFFKDKLGFSTASIWDHEGQKVFAIVGMDMITLALQVHGPVGTGDVWACYCYVDDIDAYADDVRRRGGDIVWGPEDAPYGCREIEVIDPDGNRICFGQDLSPGDLGPGL
ncbi:MAG: glyoxalase superfamily protein [Pseudomonadota bacterium]